MWCRVVDLGQRNETKRTCKDKRRFRRSKGARVSCKNSAELPCRSFCCTWICRSDVIWGWARLCSGSCRCSSPWLSGRCFEILSLLPRSSLNGYGQSNLKGALFTEGRSEGVCLSDTQICRFRFTLFVLALNVQMHGMLGGKVNRKVTTTMFCWLNDNCTTVLERTWKI